MPGIGQKSDFSADGEENTFLRTGKKSAYLQAKTTAAERSGRNPIPEIRAELHDHSQNCILTKYQN